MCIILLHRAAHEAGAPVAIVNIGKTRADEFVSLKINARCGEVGILCFDLDCLLPQLKYHNYVYLEFFRFFLGYFRWAAFPCPVSTEHRVGNWFLLLSQYPPILHG